jgi:hypothetical protein
LLRQMKACSQTVLARGHTLAVSENGGFGHQNMGSRLDCKAGSCRIDAPVHLEFACGFDPVDHLANRPDLWQVRFEETLMAETRVTVITNT